MKDQELSNDLKEIYKDVLPDLSLLQKFVTIYRPYYAPVKEVFGFINKESSVLDLGCGTGAILYLIHKHCRIESGVGIDINTRSIQIARKANIHKNLRFETGILQDYDKHFVNSFNVFLCFDILHHIPREEKFNFLDCLIDSMPEKGTLILKDLDKYPWHRSFANNITDYLSTKSVVSYESVETLIGYFEEHGLRVSDARRIDRWIWNHFLVIAKR